MQRRAHGFTLLEMMVVVAIIAILSVIAVFSITRNSAERETEKFTAIVLDHFKIAAERAKNLKKVYTVRITQTTVQWCETSCLQSGTPRGEVYDGAKDSLRVKNLKYAKMADFGRSRGFRLWEYGVGDTVRHSTFVTLTRVAEGEYVLKADVDCAVRLGGKTFTVTVADLQKNGGAMRLK